MPGLSEGGESLQDRNGFSLEEGSAENVPVPERVDPFLFHFLVTNFYFLFQCQFQELCPHLSEPFFE